MITDYYRGKWPYPYTHPVPIVPMIPNDRQVIPMTPDSLPKYPLDRGNAPYKWPITKEQWEEYKELKRLMQEYDEKSGQPHCAKPDIVEWEDEIEKHLTYSDTST
jgi:hypothetical protein